jgi:hypothetical protein
MLLLGAIVADPGLDSASAKGDITAAAAIARGCIRMHLDPSVSGLGLPPDAVFAKLGDNGQIGLKIHSNNRG